MNRLAEVLPRLWSAPELPGYRAHPRRFVTYSGFSYDELPPLPEVPEGRLRWLEGDSPKEEWSLRIVDEPFAEKLRALTDEAGIALPPDFATFMLSPELQSRVRSCTACYLQLPDRLVPTVGAEEGHLLHFLSDQQWCLHWYLHINKNDEECVLCSPRDFGFVMGEAGEDGGSSSGPAPIDPREKAMVCCAPSFGEFLHRYWMENEIWFALNSRAPLSEAQREYVEHYRARSR